MIKKILLTLTLITMLTGLNLRACPFKITNDSKAQILVVNPNGGQAIRIEPQKTLVIDPTINGTFLWVIPWGWFYNEKLNIYLQDEKDGTFYLAYQLTEKYCVKDFETKNRLSLSAIKKLHKKPTDRLQVKVFEKQKHIPHGPHKH